MSALRLLLMGTWAAWIWLELVVVLGPAVVARLRRRGGETGATPGLAAAAAVAFGAAIWLSRQPAGTLPAPPVALIVAGLAPMWAGLALRIAAIHHLGGLLRPLGHGEGDRRLVTTGPYRLVRHPALAGALLAAAGFGVALGRWTSLAALLAGWGIGAAWAARVEERALERTFGDAYEAYRARTRPFI